MKTVTHPPTGERIAAEVERELEERLYRLRHVVLAPAEYHIYLHPDDFRHIEEVAPRIALDVQLCLNSLVERLNRRSRLTRLVVGRQAPVEIPAGGWAIHIKPAANNEVAPGELGIHSRLSVPAAARFGSGAGTTRIAHTVVSGTDRRTVVHTQADVPAQSGSQPGVVAHSRDREAEARPHRTQPDGAASGGHSSSPINEAAAPSRDTRSAAGHRARLAYSDDTGAGVFAITKDLIKIGRGGSTHWVDLAIVTGPKVSREHCRIRRDAHDRYFIQDVSTWGTFVNGSRVPKYSEGTASERELPDGASIRLADAVTLEFRVDRQ